MPKQRRSQSDCSVSSAGCAGAYGNSYGSGYGGNSMYGSTSMYGGSGYGMNSGYGSGYGGSSLYGGSGFGERLFCPAGVVLLVQNHCTVSVLALAAACTTGRGCGEQHLASCILHSRWRAPTSLLGCLSMPWPSRTACQISRGWLPCAARLLRRCPAVWQRSMPGKQPAVSPRMLLNPLWAVLWCLFQDNSLPLSSTANQVKHLTSSHAVACRRLVDCAAARSSAWAYTTRNHKRGCKKMPSNSLMHMTPQVGWVVAMAAAMAPPMARGWGMAEGAMAQVLTVARWVRLGRQVMADLLKHSGGLAVHDSLVRGLHVTHMRTSKVRPVSRMVGYQLHLETGLRPLVWKCFERAAPLRQALLERPSCITVLFRGVSSLLCIAESSSWLGQGSDCTAVCFMLQYLFLRASHDGSMPTHSAGLCCAVC